MYPPHNHHLPKHINMKQTIQMILAGVFACLFTACGTTQAQAQREVRGAPMSPEQHAQYLQRQDQLRAQYQREMQEMNERSRREAQRLQMEQERREYNEYLRWQQGQAQIQMRPPVNSEMSRYQRSLQPGYNGGYNQPQGPVGYGNPQGGRYSSNPNDQSNLGGGYPAAVYRGAPITYENTYKGNLPTYQSSGYAGRLPTYQSSGYQGNAYRRPAPRPRGVR